LLTTLCDETTNLEAIFFSSIILDIAEVFCGEIKIIFSPVTDLILYEIYPYIYVIICFVVFIFILILAILILLILVLRNKSVTSTVF
jgi:hypothetical protein